MPRIERVQLKVGLEIHVELSTRRKMFAPSGNIAHPRFDHAEPNTLTDPVVLGLPGALPVMNKDAVELSAMVGMALGCEIASVAKWDRKSYFYADMPKNYQISQYPLPLCFDGAVELPPITPDGKVDLEAMVAQPAHGGVPGTRIGIIRAHLEEDAGKLLHEAPGGIAIDHSLVDLNRAGTPLLEIVTQPDFTSAEQVVVFAQMLRDICRFVGATEGVMQKGHMRFEPNINCVLTLDDGRVVATPIVEVKNLNSFKSLRGAIEYETKHQPYRWLADGKVMGPGAKTTRGWDDVRSETYVQREKEDAHDYRYFPDPDLVPVVVSDAWRESIRAKLPELPLVRARRYAADFGLSPKEAAALVDERDACLFYERVIDTSVSRGVERPRAGRLAANFVLQSGAKRANERSTPERAVLVCGLGITPDQVGAIVAMRHKGELNSNAADELFGLLCDDGAEHGSDAEQVAQRRGMIVVRDEGAMDAWCAQAIAENAKSAEDVKAGKVAAIGRLVGAVMKLSGGSADAAAVRAKLLETLGVKG
jgi:aspartyl-tRNA(Asn)/glutamyl-tRNA(Gln) amidotransferase subunit B